MQLRKIKKDLAVALSPHRRSAAVQAHTGRHRIVGSVSAISAAPSRPAIHRAFARGWAEKQTEGALLTAPSWARVRKAVHVVKAKLRGLVTSDEMNRWLGTHNSAFGRRTPLEAIYYGETGRVLETLAQLE